MTPNTYKLETKKGTFVFEQVAGVINMSTQYSCEDLVGELIGEQSLIKMGAVPLTESKQIEKPERCHYCTIGKKHLYQCNLNIKKIEKDLEGKCYLKVGKGGCFVEVSPLVDKINEIIDHLQKG